MRSLQLNSVAGCASQSEVVCNHAGAANFGKRWYRPPPSSKQVAGWFDGLAVSPTAARGL